MVLQLNHAPRILTPMIIIDFDILVSIKNVVWRS